MTATSNIDLMTSYGRSPISHHPGGEQLVKEAWGKDRAPMIWEEPGC
jgi:hypothetical protein